MKILVIGGGGREHALVSKLRQSPSVEEIYCIPGNAGISGESATCVNLNLSEIDALVRFAGGERIDLTVVGPEAPLVKGIVDRFEEAGLRIFGPSSQAAQIEGSKIFAKNLMKKYGIPTAAGLPFFERAEAIAYVNQNEPPFVIKANGLAAGKGVTIVTDREVALDTLEEHFTHHKFGLASERVVIEEFLEGQEVSVLAFTDGKTVSPMIPAQDYKRVYDGDEGPNTGGMGSYAPVPIVTNAIYQEIIGDIIEPTVTALTREGIKYKGVLYGGLILTADGPRVLEFNVRFGDPETQAILPLLQSDLAEIILAVIEERLADFKLSWSSNKCVTVVLASQGYPENYKTGVGITGLEEAGQMRGINVFHAGTALANEKFITAGGRVLNVSASGSTFAEARQRAYAAIEKIHFEGMHYRKDIALRATST